MRTLNPGHNQIRCEVVTTYEQLLHAYAVRSICFIEEHGYSARQEFDGNDYQATHIIVYAGDEPIGTQRIRWFKDFAKMERTAFRAAYRNSHVLKTCAYFVFEHIARKGYSKTITHAQPKYARMWRIVLGFKNAEGKAPFYFDGHVEPYIELVKDLLPPPNAISVSTDPAILFRVEGSWDAPSEYETAAARRLLEKFNPRRSNEHCAMRTINSGHNQIRCEVVTTYERLLHTYAVRAICFMEEHGVKAQQNFDGNDYQATHLIVYAGDEPVGALRIRWFKDFAKLERLAFREAYRNTHVLKAFVFFAFDHVARKGYDKAIAHAQPKYARLWRIAFGCRNAEGKPPVYFDGHEQPYIELVKDLLPPPNAISVSTDPAILFRVEGLWDAPSQYETEAA